MGTELVPFEQRSRPPASADTRAKPSAFDYSQLPDGVAEACRNSAERIRSLEHKLAKGIFEIGRLLIERKNDLDLTHGKWLPWVKAEFGWSERTAQRYMGAAERFGAHADTMAVLGITAIHALVAPSTPQETGDDIVTRLERGERITSQMVQEQVKAARKKPKATAASSAVEDRAVERKVDEATATPPARQSRPDQDRQADAVASAWRAADLILDQLRQDREELASLLEVADAHELVERLRQGLDVRSR
jgi:hypothetical protein